MQLRPNRPFVGEQPAVTIDAGLPLGPHRFRLESGSSRPGTKPLSAPIFQPPGSSGRQFIETINGDAPDAGTELPAMSPHAADILEQMEPDLGYELSELRAFVPELSMESLREVMHELWIARQVERFRDSGWRRVRSTCGSQPASVAGVAPGRNRIVKPEDLFDHDTFAGFFK